MRVRHEAVVGEAEVEDDAVSVVVDFWKRSCGEVCWEICLEAVEVGAPVAAGAVAVASAEAVLEAAVVVVLAAVLAVEIVSVEVARAAVGSPALTIWQRELRYEKHCANS